MVCWSLGQSCKQNEMFDESPTKDPRMATYIKIICIAGSIIWGYATLSAEFGGLKKEIDKIIIVQSEGIKQFWVINERLIRIEEAAKVNERARRADGFRR